MFRLLPSIAAIRVKYFPFTPDIMDETVGLLMTSRELGVTFIALSRISLLTFQFFWV